MVILALGVVTYVVRQSMQDSRNSASVQSIFAPRQDIVVPDRQPDVNVRPRP
jgi:hypothetical protein